MASKRVENDVDRELDALRLVYQALNGVDEIARIRIVLWVKDYFDMDI